MKIQCVYTARIEDDMWLVVRFHPRDTQAAYNEVARWALKYGLNPLCVLAAQTCILRLAIEATSEVNEQEPAA